MYYCHRLKVMGPLPIGRSWHTLSKIDDDRLFLYGGYSQEQVVLGKDE